MLDEMTLIHRRGAGDFGFSRFLSGTGGVGIDHFLFATCMRRIMILSVEGFERIENLLSDEDEVLCGEEAYRLLLQVICGLHSPLIGETEVFGQFKNAVTLFEAQASELMLTPHDQLWRARMARFFRTLFVDAKKVRQLHLEDLGSQSYGSVLRREVKGLRRVHLLGAGHLVQEMLPWLMKDGVDVHIHGRDPLKIARELAPIKGDVGAMKIHGLEDRAELTHAEAIVIAAPVSADWFTAWVPADATPQVVVDLRGDSAEDRVPGFARVIALGEFLAAISDNQNHLQARKRAALSEIDALVLERGRHVEYRPFGWEDVCA